MKVVLQATGLTKRFVIQSPDVTVLKGVDLQQRGRASTVGTSAPAKHAVAFRWRADAPPAERSPAGQNPATPSI
jgi:hypothetical protein